MTDETWAFSIDGETWDGPYDRETAIYEGRVLGVDGDHESFRIGRAIPTDVREWPPQSDQVLESAHDAIRDNVWRGAEPIDVSTEAEAALQVMLNAAWDAWVEIFDVEHGAFTVADIETIQVSS